MNYLLGMIAMLAMILITGSFIRGALAFLVLMAVLAAYRVINKEQP